MAASSTPQTPMPNEAVHSDCSPDSTSIATTTMMQPAPGIVRKYTIWAAVAFCVVACAVMIANRARDSADNLDCRGKMTQISMAMHEYHKKYNRFPPSFIRGLDGLPAHSWRVLLLEFLDPEMYRAYRFDEPWNSPNNRTLGSLTPRCYCCPADASSRKKGQANYFVVVGQNTVFPGPLGVNINDIERPGSTILLVEAVCHGIHWMEPRDLTLDVVSSELGKHFGGAISSYHMRGPNICMADGAKYPMVRFNHAELQHMLLRKSNDKPDE